MPSIRLSPGSSSLRAIRTTTLTRTTAAATRPSPSPSSLAAARPYSSSFQQGPSPPRLPPDQQAEFERLQRAVADRLADPTPLPHEQPQHQQPTLSSTSPASTPRHTTTPGSGAAAAAASAAPPRADEPTTGGVWRGAPPEFDGDKNPKTGEVGGPKTEPLRWGSAGDWSYNGRVTDF